MILKLVGIAISLFLIISSNIMLYNMMTGGEVAPFEAISTYAVAGLSFLFALVTLLILFFTSPSWKRDIPLAIASIAAGIAEFAPLYLVGVEDPMTLINWAPQTALSILFGMGFLYMGYKKLVPSKVRVEFIKEPREEWD